MTIIPPPREVIGENILRLWRQTPELANRFSDNHEGTIHFVAYAQDAILQRLKRERADDHV